MGVISVNYEKCEILWGSGFVGRAELTLSTSNKSNNTPTETLNITIDNKMGQKGILSSTSNTT